MMNKPKQEAKKPEDLSGIILEIIKVKSNKPDAKPESTLGEDLGFDSLDIVDLGMTIEKTIEDGLKEKKIHKTVNIPTEDMEKWVTIANVIEYVRGVYENYSTETYK